MNKALWHRWLPLIGAALVFIMPAFIQGAPFYDFDSGDYLHTATRLSSSLSRPPFYGIFVLLSGGTINLWASLLLQGLILSIALRQLLFALQGYTALRLLGIALLWSLCSPVARLASQIMPDSFATAFLLLSLAWLLRPQSLHKGLLLLWIFLAFCHTALMPLLALVLLLALVRKKPLERWPFLRTPLLLSLGLGAVLLAANYGKVKRLCVVPASDAFATAKFARSGALQEVLVAQGNSATVSRDFNFELWSPQGFVAQQGGLSDTQKHLHALNQAVRSNPKAMQLHWQQTQRDFYDVVQRHSWEVSAYTPQSYTAQVLQERFPWHFQQAASRRWWHYVPQFSLDALFGLSLSISYLLALVLLVFRIRTALGQAAGYALLLVLAHHALVAWYSIPDNRLSARVSCVLVLLPLLLLIPGLSSKRQSASAANPLPPHEPSRAGAASPLP